MNEGREVYEALDLALRIGEVLLSSGAGAADVTVTMVAVTTACGVHNVSADVTSTDLTLHHQPSPSEPAAVQVRRVAQREVDYADSPMSTRQSASSSPAGSPARRRMPSSRRSSPPATTGTAGR